MSDFSIGDAVGSGFGLIAKRPVAVVVWGLIYALIVGLPAVLLCGFMLTDLPALMSSLQHMDPTAGPPPALFAFQSRMMLLNPLMLVTSLAGRALLAGAIFRAVLEPENRKYLSLRFGKQELWLALVLLAYGVVIGFAIFAILILAAMLGGLGWLVGGLLPSPGSGLLRALFIVAAVVGAIGGSIWVAVRLSLAPVITFAEKEFRLFESWNLTKGHVWKLIGLVLILWVIASFIGSIFYGLFFAGVVSMFGGFDAGHVKAFFENLDARSLASTLAPRIGAFAVVAVLLIGPLSAIFLAPWAVAYRELSKGAKPQHPPVF